MTAAVVPVRLAPWRLAAGSLILGALALVLLSLAPVYLQDYRLKGYFRQVAATASGHTDLELRAEIVDRARALGLPLQPGEIKISRTDGRIALEMRYAVHFQMYQVDLHFHASAPGH